jgi:hypothetical protein
MLGCIVSGRLVRKTKNHGIASRNSFNRVLSGFQVQTDFQQVGETQFLINIPDADNINHVVIFLTG